MRPIVDELNVMAQQANSALLDATPEADQGLLLALLILDGARCLAQRAGTVSAIAQLMIVSEALAERPPIPPPADTPETTP